MLDESEAVIFRNYIKIREQMLKLASINAPESILIDLNKRLYDVEITPQFGVKSKEYMANVKLKRNADEAKKKRTALNNSILFGVFIGIFVLGAIAGFILWILNF